MRNIKKTAFTLLFALSVGLTSKSFAIEMPLGANSFDPGVIDQKNLIEMKQYEERKRIEQEEQAEEKILMEKKVFEELENLPKADTVFHLNTINFKGNTVFTEEELLELFCDKIETDVTLADILQTVSKITSMYHNEGYISSLAYVPPQRIEDGNVEIVIVEGKYGNITLEGNKWSRDKYIRKQFLEDNGLEEGKILNIKDVQNSLHELNSVGYLKGAITLQDNEESVELTDVVYEAKDRFPFKLDLRFDNQGRSEIGLNRFSIFTGMHNLTGFGDQLLSTTTLGKHSTSQGVFYSVPFAKKESKLNLGYSYSGTRLGDFGPIERVRGKSHNFFIGASRRLIETDTYKMYGDISLDIRNTKTLARFNGRDDNEIGYPYNTRNIRLSLSNIKDDFYGKWFGNVGASFGIPWFDADDTYYSFEHNKSQPCNKAIKLNANIARLQVLPWRSLGVFQLNGQWANRGLWYSEKMQVGGISSVRGYQEAFSLGDYGITASAEFRFPIPFFGRILPTKLKFLDESIRLAAFYDFGWFGDRYADYDSDYLMSVGGGLVLKLTKYMSGNVYFGVPVGKKPEDASNMRVHFTVTSNIL